MPGKIIIRRLFLLLCCAGLVGGMGCVSMWANDGHRQRRHEFHNAPVLQDRIVAFGMPDAALMKLAGTNEVIALLGTNRTYILLEGAARLTNIAAQVNSSNLQMHTFRSLYRKGDVFWGEIVLYSLAGTNVTASGWNRPDFKTAIYDSTTGIAPDSEMLNRLESLGFQREYLPKDDPFRGSMDLFQPIRSVFKAYTLHIPVKGVIRPVVKVGAARAEGRSFDLALFNAPEAKPSADLGYWAVKMPLAFVADVALSPVYLLGIVTFGIAGALN